MAHDCEDIMRQYLGRDMTEEEILDMQRQANILAKGAQGGVNAANQLATIQQLSQIWHQRQLMVKAAAKRAAWLQHSTRLKAVNYICDTFKGNEVEGLKALLTGSNRARAGARLSVGAQRDALRNNYAGGLVNDLERLSPEHFKAFSKGTLDKEIYIALYEKDNPNIQTSTPVSKTASKIADVIYKWQETARMAENAAGAWIGKVRGYVMRQNHDQLKIQKAGAKKWASETEGWLDWEKTADGQYLDVSTQAGRIARDEFLLSTYNALKSGIHERFGQSRKHSASAGQFGASLAKRASDSRILHFKDGLSRYNYDQKYGTGNLREGVIRGLIKSADDTALMRTFGPDPVGNFTEIIGKVERALLEQGNDKGLKKFQTNRTMFDNIMMELDGTINIGGNPSVATVARVVRTMQNMAKLGGAVIAGLADVPGFGMEMRYQGYGFFNSLLKGVWEVASEGRGSLAQREILSECGVFFDSIIGNCIANFGGGEGVLGKLTAAQNMFFRLNCLSWWTDSLKKAACLMMSHGLANAKNQAYSQLNKKLARVLSLYGIDEGRWEMIRKGATKAADGREYLTPDAALQAADKEVEAYMVSKGMLVSEARIKAFKYEMAEQMRSYFRDRTQYAMLEPDARTASIMHQGTKSGTVVGEGLRLAGQFKSFGVAVLQRSVGREVYGYGADTLGKGLMQAIIPHKGELTGFAGFIVATTIAGYLSMSIKHMLQGKTPRDFTESPEAFGKALIASMLQGGALGLYGDFLWAEKSRTMGGFAEAALGPTAGLIGAGQRLWQDAIRGDEDFAPSAMRMGMSYTPGNNLFWARAALDYMIMNSFYEIMSPGFVERTRKRMAKETNQEYFWEPNVWDWAKKEGERKKREKRLDRSKRALERRQEERKAKGKGGFFGPVIKPGEEQKRDSGAPAGSVRLPGGLAK